MTTTTQNRRRKQRRLEALRGLPAVVDAAPAGAHLRRILDAGVPVMDLAAATGLGDNTIGRLIHGRVPRVYRTTAEKALALPMPPRGYRPRTDGEIAAVAAARRLQALAVAGWPLAPLGEAIGMSPSTIRRVRSGKHTIWVSTHLTIRDAAERLHLVDPRAHGVTQSGYTRARLHAARRGWVPLACWDDDEIGDLSARPKGVSLAVAGGVS